MAGSSPLTKDQSKRLGGRESMLAPTRAAAVSARTCPWSADCPPDALSPDLRWCRDEEPWEIGGRKGRMIRSFRPASAPRLVEDYRDTWREPWDRAEFARASAIAS